MSITCLKIIGSYFLPGVTLATALSSVWAGGQSCSMEQMTKHWIPCGSEMSRAESHIGQPHLLTQREQDPLLPFLLYVWRKQRDGYGGDRKTQNSMLTTVQMLATQEVLW